MLSSKLRERSLCLINFDNLDSTFQPWLTISDAKFHPDVCTLYCHSNINPIQSIQTNYLPPFISYLWPLIYHGANVWAVDHPTTREITRVKFVLKYDLLIWNIFYRSTNINSSLNSNIVYPKVLILAPDWFTCENTYKHLSNVNTDILKKIIICCIYEGRNIENELYKKFLTQGCDLLIATPTIVNDLIQKRYIHFERLEMIVYDQFDLLLQTIESINEILNLIQLHKNKITSIQHFFLSRIVNQQTKNFIYEHFSSNKNYYYLSSSMMETHTYKNFFVYCEPCRNWTDRKYIIKETLDLAIHCQKKIVMCAHQIRRLATMQSILNDLSIQSILIHSQLTNDEIQQYIYEWQTINDRLLILLIQDDILNDITIDNTDIIIHLDIQRFIWYQLYNQRMKLIHKHLLNNNINMNNKIKKIELTSIKLIEKFYQLNTLINIPLIVILWPGDCAQVTYDLIDYINNSNNYLHPLIERLAKNNCYESLQAKINVELCPTLKMFGQCLNEKILKRCPYRHHFHYDVDYIEQQDKKNENFLTDSYELCLPNKGEIELRITHVSDGNRLWANILRTRNDINQTLIKIFDYDLFYKQIENGFNYVKNQPLSEITPGEIYFYIDNYNKIHRVYVYEQEHTYFDIRRADSILNRLLKVSNTIINKENIQDTNKSTINEKNSSLTTVDHPTLVVFSLDTGITFTLKSNEYLYPIEPSSLKQYPPLATEIILCNICPLDKITMTFTPFTIETVRSLTLNEIFMGRIKLATRSCFWIDPLVKPVRLAALKRVAYDKPIRKQLILSKLVQSNDNHMNLLERMAMTAKLNELTISNQEKEDEINEQSKFIIKSNEQDIIKEEINKQSKSIIKSNEQDIIKEEINEQSKSIIKSNEQSQSIIKSNEQDIVKEEIIEDFLPVFKPFCNRSGQLIINPVGRSKQFFIKHNQELQNFDFVKRISSEINDVQSTIENNNTIDRYIPLGRGHKIHTESSSSLVKNILLSPPPSISNIGDFQHSDEYSPFQTLVNIQQSSIDSNVTTPSEVEPSKMIQCETKTEQIEEQEEDEIFEDTTDTIPNPESSIPTTTTTIKSLELEQETIDDNDQMMFIFGPKLFSQLRQIKDMEDEQRRQADFPVQRNRNRHMRNNNNNNNLKSNNQDNNNNNNNDDINNEINEQKIPVPNMSRYEPFIDERGPLTQEQIDYKQTQRKTRLFWEQTSRDIYLTIGFYNVDSTQTRVEFEKNSIYCRTKIRTYDRFVRIYLAYDIIPEKCLFQVRRSNILLTIRKANEGFMWTTLTNRPIEPRPDFFIIDYGSDDESDTEKRRRTVNQQWEQIRDDKRQLKLNDDNKYLIDDIDDDDHQQQQQQQQNDKLNNIDDDNNNNQQELTDTSSGCHSTDSDDCYYEDQVPASHIPQGYDEADYDHRFYGQQIRS
ncbi:unnamed protein product [Rotaria sordida]|uniref:RNA helicase n=1 Tax=Rotaria sordida TaxID=392033 RepID=A0A815J8D9_9BILA|nr:unnamed protein product [Rotaria sordida]